MTHRYSLHYTPTTRGRARGSRKRMTYTESVLWSMIRHNQLGVRFRRQAPIYNYIVDFVCVPLKLIVEVDGIQHSSLRGSMNDRIRDSNLSSLGYQILRFSNDDVESNIDEVLSVIIETIDQLRPA